MGPAKAGKEKSEAKANEEEKKNTVKEEGRLV